MSFAKGDQTTANNAPLVQPRTRNAGWSDGLVECDVAERVNRELADLCFEVLLRVVFGRHARWI